MTPEYLTKEQASLVEAIRADLEIMKTFIRKDRASWDKDQTAFGLICEVDEFCDNFEKKLARSLAVPMNEITWAEHFEIENDR